MSTKRKPAAPPPNTRALWRPKRREIPKQCVGCPFREGNDAELQKVVAKIDGAIKGVPLDAVRFSIKFDLAEVQHSGDFACHETVYVQGSGKPGPSENFRQCKGATRWFKEGAKLV